MLDRGCDGVIIPHIEGLEHAKQITAAAKYPPLGVRSFAGGRSAGFGPVSPDHFQQCNNAFLSIPMIETAGSLAAVDEIACLPTVDALFVGPYDLSLASGCGAYRKIPEDYAALQRISAAAAAAKKPWWMPAWTEKERASARMLGAQRLVVAEELGFFQDGLKRLTDELDELRESPDT
jgi:4-hydroxy-2-oxoheptanedioate aldolase